MSVPLISDVDRTGQPEPAVVGDLAGVDLDEVPAGLVELVRALP
jgi:hypothetical protein